jgi:hypothetical protein
MGSKKVRATVAMVVTVAAVGSMYLTLVGLPPRVDVRPHEALGEVMARESRKLLGTGGRILLIRRDTTLHPNPAADAQLRAFHRELRKTGVSVTTTLVIKTDPLRLLSVPSGDFFQLLKSGSETDVAVSFAGPPILTADQVAKLAGKGPKVVAICTGDMPRQTDLKQRFDQKLVQAAILSRQVVPSVLPSSDAPQAWFDHYFVVASPENLSELLSASRP